MSVRNTLKNLGTVIECSENGDDTSSAIRQLHRKNIPDHISTVETAKQPDAIADEPSPYHSAHSSMDDFMNAEINEQNMLSSKASTSYVQTLNIIQEAKCDVNLPNSEHQENSGDELSEYDESDEENEIIGASNISSFPAAKPRVGTSQNPRPKSFIVGRPFNHSRLSLITFLNNIATPSMRTAQSVQRIHQPNTSKKRSLLPFTFATAEIGTSHTLNLRESRSSDASVKKQQNSFVTSAITIKTDKNRTSAEETKSPINVSIVSENIARDPMCQSATSEQGSAEKTAVNDDTNRLSADVPTQDMSPGTVKTSLSRASHTDEAATSTRTVYSGKSCDKISTTSDMTVASVFSVSSLSNGSNATNLSAKHKSRECVICCVRQSASHFMRLKNCGHRSCCKSCVVKYLNIEIMENRTELSCPQCSESLHVNDIYVLLARLPQLLERYECFSLRRVLSTDPDTRWCPAPDCTYAVIASACAACPQLSCGRPGCGTMFCYHCKNYWHANQTCDQARESENAAFMGSFAKAFSRDEASTSAKTSKGSQHSFDAVKSCPRCGALIVKMNDGSCNHMTCALCGVEFCWLCLKQINELHYISPTGCTFWGKKPWTRKKKLLWQIGTLIGAPLGIALIAGLAVPGIICGVPIFVGRRTYQRFGFLSRTKRHLITAVSVTGSLLVSPVLAVMAVGVGVPIMLAYVYGVVPLSLCRNGGCGSGADAQELPYTAADAEESSILMGEVQERSQLLRALRENEPGTSRGATILVSAPPRKAKKSTLNITTSDRSTASSPSGMFCGSGLRATDVSNVMTKSLASSLRGGEVVFLKERTTPGGEASVGSASTFQGRVGETGGGCSVSRVVSTNSQRQAHRGAHRRQNSNESGVMSFCDKVNTEDASVRAIAGSQCNYDDRSVNTIWSSNVVHANAADCMSGACLYNNDDNASTKACGGSVLGARSLAESGASSTLPHLAFLSRENDMSPGEALRVIGDEQRRKSGQLLDDEEKHNLRSGRKSVGSVSPSPAFFGSKSNCKTMSTSCDELNNYHSQYTDPQLQPSGDCRPKISRGSKSSCVIGAGPSTSKKASVVTLPSTSQRSFRSGATCSSIASVTSSNSDFSASQSTNSAKKNSTGAKKSANAMEKTLLPERQESSRLSLRKLIRRPIDLLTGRGMNNNSGGKKKLMTTATIAEVREGPNQNSKSVKICTK